MSVSICSSQTKLCDTSYLVYHELINQAEKSYYLRNNVDSSFYYYDKAFSNFSFIFLKDLLNAAQISAFTNNSRTKEYLQIATKYGFEIKHLTFFPLFKPITNELLNDTIFTNQAKRNRSIYLKNINYTCLLKIYDLGIVDQIDKNKPDEEYSILKKKTISTLIDIIKEFGFPSSKLLGINSESIFEEGLKKPQYDLNKRKLRYSNTLSYYKAEDTSFNFTKTMTILIHNKCAYKELETMLYNAFLKGEIHPREIGCLYDNLFSNCSRFESCSIPDINEGIFYLNLFAKFSNFSLNRDKINSLRAKWKIVELEVDEKKKEFEVQYGFKLFHGFWKCM
jgi:hypothetical protein